MNENFNKELEQLRIALSPLDEKCPMPASLNAEMIMHNAEMPVRRTWLTPQAAKRGIALAASLALVCVSLLVFNRGYNLRENYNSAQPPAASSIASHNIETPDANIQTQVAMGDWQALEAAFLRMRLEAEERMAEYDDELIGLSSFWRNMVPGRAAIDMEMAMPMEESQDSAALTAQNAASHGETNTQVQGVGESDILKNDGQYLYYLRHSFDRFGNSEDYSLFILRPLPANNMQLVSRTIIPASFASDMEMYVMGDRLAVVYTSYGDDVRANARLYDISDRANPVELRHFAQEGTLTTSRLLNGRVYLLSNHWKTLDFRTRGDSIPPGDILPLVYEDSRAVLLPPERIAVLPEANEPSYLILSSIDVNDANADTESAAILGAGTQVYCSMDALYVARMRYTRGDIHPWARIGWWGIADQTVIYRFDLLPNGQIRPGPQGEVKGVPLNQFSMDEHNGYFRIATTAPCDQDESVNIITILDSNLRQVSTIEGIAPTERIQSARFMGDMGYIVTFRDTDPLYVIDLSNPRAPKILGELKITGFSGYLHPWGDKHLVGVGPDGCDVGLNGDTKVSLFDISDPADPREVDRVIVPSSHVGIQHNHKIFVPVPEKGVFGLPIYDTDHGGSSFYTFRVQGSTISGLHRLDAVESPVNHSWGWTQQPVVERGTFIGDTWYVIGSERSLAAYSMANGREIGRLRF